MIGILGKSPSSFSEWIIHLGKSRCFSMAFNPFAFPQILHTIIFITSTGLLISAFHSHSLSISKFLADRPSISDLFSGSRTKLFSIFVNVTCVCILFISYQFLKYARSRKASLTVSILSFFLLLCTIVALGGFLGFVNFPSSSSPGFHAVTEIIFLAGLEVCFVLHEVITKVLKKRIQTFILIHEVAIAIPIAMVICARAISLAEWTTPLFTPFLIEYAAYLGLFSKFPLMGWQMYGKREVPDPQKWQ
jgi:hypothetical protein